MESFIGVSCKGVLVPSLVLFGVCYILLMNEYKKDPTLIFFSPLPKSPFAFKSSEASNTEEGSFTCFLNVATERSESYGCHPRNVPIFENVKFGNTSSSLRVLGMDKYRTCDRQRQTLPEVPVLVSAVSQNHYAELAYFCKNLNETLKVKFPNLTLVVYDLEIQKVPESSELQRFCGCQMRRFPFSQFPNHVRNLRGYTWKPLVIAFALQEFPFVMWLDASVRFNTKRNITKLWDKARHCHIQQMSTPGYTLGEQTHMETIHFLKQDGHVLVDMKGVAAGWGVYIRSKLMIEKILKPWVLCALTHGCMITASTENGQGPCIHKKPRQSGICHRFEQAVLGIILSKVYGNQHTKYIFHESDFGFVRRGETIEYRGRHLIKRQLLHTY